MKRTGWIPSTALFGIQTAVVQELDQDAEGVHPRHAESLHDRCLKTLAAVLVEFAEDLHCGIGIWHSLERSNREVLRHAPALRP